MKDFGDNKTDICLVSPPTRASSITVPISLLYLHAWLTGKNILGKIVDIKHGKQGVQLSKSQVQYIKEKIVDEIAHLGPGFVGITCYSTEFWEVLDLARAVKQKTECKIIVGGIHANIMPEDFFFSGSPVDFAVSGDGQEPLAETIRRINSREPLDGIAGLGYADKAEGVILQGTASFSDWDKMPNPDYSQLDMDYYTKPNTYIVRSLLASGVHIFTTVGCPFLCTFCCNRNRKVKFRPIEKVLDEIEGLKNNYHIDSFYIQDDTFCIKKSRVRELVDGLCKRKINLFWGMETRVNLVDEEIIKMVSDAGCIQADFGVESGSDAALKRMKKGAKNADTVKAFELCKKYNVRTYANIMFNTPEETEEDVEMTINLLEKIRPTRIGLGLTVPFPGCELYNMYINPPLTKDEYRLFNHPDLFFKVVDPRFRLAKHDINLTRLRIRTKAQFGGFRALFDFTLKSLYWKVLRASKRKKQYLKVFVTEFILERTAKIFSIFRNWIK